MKNSNAYQWLFLLQKVSIFDPNICIRDNKVLGNCPVWGCDKTKQNLPKFFTGLYSLVFCVETLRFREKLFYVARSNKRLCGCEEAILQYKVGGNGKR